VAGTAAAPQSHFTALEATLPITVASRAEPGKTTPLTANQSVSVTGPRHAAKVGPVRHLNRAQALRESHTAELPSHAGEVGDHKAGRRRAETPEESSAARLPGARHRH
jgi:hypothetical protein